MMAGSICRLRERFPEHPAVCELGSQTLTVGIDGEDIKTVPEFYKFLGFSQYESIDFDGKGTISLDLNKPHGWLEIGSQFDLVTNNGTGEHIFNQQAVFETCHNLCKQNGHMLHVLPWINWRNHGFYNFHPSLFRDLAEANGYEIVSIFAGNRDGMVTHEGIEFGEDKNPTPTDQNIMLVCCLKKLGNNEFQVPIQEKYRARPDMERVSVLESSPDKYGDPFPHLIGRLDEDYIKELEENFPDPQVIVAGRKEKSNILLQRSAVDLIQDGGYWADFAQMHTSKAFLQDIIRAFGEDLSIYPQLRSYALEAGVRFRDDKNFSLDCQLAINTPCKERSRVRGPHIDDPKQLYAGLVYFGAGELILYRWKGKREFIGREGMIKRAEAPDEAVEEVKRLKCERGTVLFFLNTSDSLHGVEYRDDKDYRKYINIIGEVPEPLFELKDG